jgi:hypothetical protein
MLSGQPLWFLILLPAIDFGLPVFLLLIGLLLLRKTLKSRNSAALVCAKCKYDMRSATSLSCPECGYTHKTVTQLSPSKRFFFAKLTSASLLCLPGLYVVYISLVYYPAAYFRYQQSLTTIKFLQSHGANCQPTAEISQVAPPFWTRKLRSWLQNPPFHTIIYPNRSNRDHVPVWYLSPRTVDAGFLKSTLAETLVNWTWLPSRNYHAYLPFPQYSYVFFDPASPCILTPDDAARISNLPGIRYIHLGSNVRVDGPTLAAFASLSENVHLFVGDYQPTPWDAANWPASGRIKALVAININGDLPPSDSFLTMLTLCPQFSDLSVDIDSRHPMSDNVFSMLVSCPQFHKLSIRSSQHSPHDRLMDAALKCDQLQSLSFQGIPITLAHLEKLEKFKRLHTLALELPPNSPLTDADLAPLGKLLELRNFTLKNAPRVTGAFLPGLKKRLESLTLSNAPIDDQALSSLVYHRGLHELSLQNTQITPAAFKMYSRVLPLDTVRYDKPIDMDTCRDLAWPQPFNLSLSGVTDEQLNLLLARKTYCQLHLYDHRLSDALASQVKAGKFNFNSGPNSQSRRQVILMNDSPPPPTNP